MVTQARLHHFDDCSLTRHCGILSRPSVLYRDVAWHYFHLFFLRFLACIVPTFGGEEAREEVIWGSEWDGNVL